MHRLYKLLYDLLSWWKGSTPPEDSFVDLERDFLRKLVSPTFEWQERAETSPMKLPAKPLEECRVALVSTAGIFLQGDQPFAAGRLGDPTFRVIPRESPMSRLKVRHPGYDTRRARRNLNCVFPLEHLRALAEEGKIGPPARRHYSFMGYALKTRELEQNAARIAAQLAKDSVDLVLLAPA